MKFVRFAFLILCISVLGLATEAQTATPTPASAPSVNLQTWSLNTAAITLPGGKQTFVGVDSGISFTPTPNLDLFDRNVIATGAGFGYYAGGFNYRFPSFGTMLNNQSPNVNFLRLQVGITGSFGVDRIQLPNNLTAQHYGWTAGLFADYQLTSGGAWTLGVKAEYVQFPGEPGSHVAISLNPSFHF
jgi:hypothetical protein